MFTVVVVIHMLLAVALVAVILVQKSEGGALGIGGGGGMSGFMTGRSTANLLTRATAVLVACFFGTSIALALIAAHGRTPSSVIGQPVTTQPEQPTPAAPGAPATTPAAPAAPLTK